MALFEADEANLASAHAQCRQRDVHHLVSGNSLQVLFRGSYLGRGIMLAQHLAGSRARDVHGDIAAADNDDFLPDGELVAEIDVEQELDAAMHAIEIDARDREVAAAMCANCDQDRVEALAPQLAYREVASGGGVQAKRY